jgi:hypothetical protein
MKHQWTQWLRVSEDTLEDVNFLKKNNEKLPIGSFFVYICRTINTNTTMKNLKLKLTSAMFALVLSVLLMVTATSLPVFVLSVGLILLQTVLWGKLMKEIKE